MAERQVNCRGMQCPGPLVQVALEAKKSSKGDVLVVTATDMGFKRDISAWAAKTGHELLSVEDCDGLIQARIRIC